MIPERHNWALGLIGISLLLYVSVSLMAAPAKVKVIVENATVKVKPLIGGETLARVRLNEILETEKKQGEWYKVFIEKEGVKISGYIHEMLVEVVKEETVLEPGTPLGLIKSQSTILAEIEAGIEENRKLIRQEKEFEQVAESLRRLIAKVFKVEDNKKQKEMATEIFLLRGLAFAGLNDKYSALLEFRNMFEVDHLLAKEITRNLYNPDVNVLIQQAEKRFLGLERDYSLEIDTIPGKAEIVINGEKIGFSPEIYRTIIPKLVIEIEKDGYKPVKEEVFLVEAETKKKYALERIGRDIEVWSNILGAEVYLDGLNTQKVTNCILPFIPFGIHKLKVTKENYKEWKGEINVEKGEDPISVFAALTGLNYRSLWTLKRSDKEPFKLPTGITIDKEGSLYVIDMGEVKIKKFNKEGRFQSQWGRAGREFKGLKSPGGIAADNQGNILVTDAKHHCVMKFSKDGKFMRKWGKEGRGTDEFKIPLGITVDDNNNIYIADHGNHRVKIYSSQFVLKKVWGSQEATEGHFIFPTALALSKNNELYVIDRFRVQKFSPDGKFIFSWGILGSGNGELKGPMGICVDLHGYLYIADSGNHRIQKFDENGVFVTKWGALGAKDNQMNFPFGIAVDSSGKVYVVERDNNRVQIFGVTGAQSGSNQ